MHKPTPNVFEAVAEITGVALPPEQQTDVVRQVLEKLTAKLAEKESLAMQDKLTGLPNRRAFDAKLETALRQVISQHTHNNKRADKTPRPKGVIVIDLDSFKRINDTMGHLAGDSALQHIANFLKTNLRPDDFIARTGGDEFMVVFEGEERIANAVMSRLQEKIGREPLHHNHTLVTLGFSFGICDIAHDMNPETIVDTADKRAYADKSGKHMRLLSAAAYVSPEEMRDAHVLPVTIGKDISPKN